jgi:drug/metabolite transporter (DMT)-like permease
MAVPSSRRDGVLLMIAAGLCWSTGGIFVRNVASTDGWEIVFWRSLFMVAFLFSVLVAWHRGAVWSKIRAVGAAGVLAGALLAATFFFFILSLMRNTAANTFVLMSTGPFFAALFGWVFLRERVPPRTWMAIGVALGGATLMFADGLDAGRTLGNLLALGVATVFALNLVVMRRMHATVDMVPAVMIAGIDLHGGRAALSRCRSIRARADLAVLAPMGCLQVGLGLPADDAGNAHAQCGRDRLLSLIETILAPIWVWLGVGERPSALALTGAAIVLGALLANEWIGLRRTSPGPPRLFRGCVAERLSPRGGGMACLSGTRLSPVRNARASGELTL